MIFTNLLVNMLVVGLHGDIPTNTTAFQQYASSVLFTNAPLIASRLNVERNQISRENMTAFKAKPFVFGYLVSAEFGNRYRFSFIRGFGNNNDVEFIDRAYYEKDVFVETNQNFVLDYNLAHKDEDPEKSNVDLLAVDAQEGDRERIRAVVRRWTSSQDHLTLRRAQKLAETTVRSLQLTGGSPKGEQRKWEDYGGRVWVQPDQLVTGENERVLDIRGMPKTGPGIISVVGPYKNGQYLVSYPPTDPSTVMLPYYEFKWNARKCECEIHVCGITSNIVYLSYTGPGIKLPMPSNYLQMLGISTNTVFVQRSFTGGFKKYEPE